MTPRADLADYFRTIANRRGPTRTSLTITSFQDLADLVDIADIADLADFVDLTDLLALTDTAPRGIATHSKPRFDSES